MTYLDPHHAQSRSDTGKWILRLIIAIGVAAFGYFAVTLGWDRQGADVVPEPVTRSF